MTKNKVNMWAQILAGALGVATTFVGSSVLTSYVVHSFKQERDKAIKYNATYDKIFDRSNNSGLIKRGANGQYSASDLLDTWKRMGYSESNYSTWLDNGGGTIRLPIPNLEDLEKAIESYKKQEQNEH